MTTTDPTTPATPVIPEGLATAAALAVARRYNPGATTPAALDRMVADTVLAEVLPLITQDAAAARREAVQVGRLTERVTWLTSAVTRAPDAPGDVTRRALAGSLATTRAQLRRLVGDRIGADS